MSSDQASAAAWARVDEYIEMSLHKSEDTFARALRDARAASAAAGLPSIAVMPNQGKALMLLARACDARHVLEVGTLGGYSTLWLAKGVGPQGRVVTLELDEKHARVARQNFKAAGMDHTIELLQGRASESLAGLDRQVASGTRPAFDMTFIDADKPSTPDYLGWAVRVSRPGAIIVIDNVVRDGEVANSHSTDPNVLGIRRTMELIAADPRLEATAIQTVGEKGYDGFLMAVVAR